jgi:hypothetical protein
MKVKKAPPPIFSSAYVFELAVTDRAETLRKIESGELEFIEFDAAVFQHDKPNKNGFLFEADWKKFAESFEGQPFVKDHKESLDALFGSILHSWLDGPRFKHTVRLTTREAMTAYAEGKIQRFSISWFYDMVKCSICRNDFFSPDCIHWPGRKYEVDGHQTVMQLIFVNPTGRHTAAVVVPASEGTEVLAALSAYKSEINGDSADDLNAGLDASQPITVLKGVHMDPKDSTTQTGAGASNTQPDDMQEAEQLGSLIRANRDAAAQLLGETERIARLEAQAQESEEILIATCENLLYSALNNSRLPDLTRARIEKQFKGRRFQANELHAAIEGAKMEIAAISNRLTISGPGRSTQMFSSDDQVRAAAFDLFAADRDPGTEALKVHKLNGIKELYLMLTGDHEFTGNVDYDLIMAGLATTTNFPGIVKDSMNKKLVKSWDEFAMADYGWWQEIVTEEHFSDLNQVDWVITGTIGSLPVVAERAEYTILPIGDNVETSDWTKYGGYVPLTLEAILRDNLQAFKAFPRELALAGMRNISEQVAAIFTSNSAVGPTLADGGALFNSTAVTTTGGHANLLTTALGTDYTAWKAIAKAMYNQPLHVAATIEGTSYLGTGKKQAVRPRFALLPIDLSDQADSLFLERWAANVEAIPTSGGRTYMGKVKPLTVPEFTDATDFAAVADPKLVPGVMLGEIFGVKPQIFIAGRENDPAMFMNDESRLKVRQFLVVGVSNYRGLHKSNVAG